MFLKEIFTDFEDVFNQFLLVYSDLLGPNKSTLFNAELTSLFSVKKLNVMVLPVFFLFSVKVFAVRVQNNPK